MSQCGLLIECADRERIPLPLTGVSVVAKIIDLVAKVSIEQRYVNRESHPIEAIYLFPVDEGIKRITIRDSTAKTKRVQSTFRSWSL